MQCRLWSKGSPCYLCTLGAKGKAFYKGHRGYRCGMEIKNGRSRMALVRPTGNQAGSGGGGVLAGSDATILFPNVWEYLTGLAWEDGSARQTSTLLVFVEDGMCKMCINDRALGRKAWATGPTPEAAITSLESCLASGAVEWRLDKAGGGGRRK